MKNEKNEYKTILVSKEWVSNNNFNNDAEPFQILNNKVITDSFIKYLQNEKNVLNPRYQRILRSYKSKKCVTDKTFEYMLDAAKCEETPFIIDVRGIIPINNYNYLIKYDTKQGFRFEKQK